MANKSLTHPNLISFLAKFKEKKKPESLRQGSIFPLPLESEPKKRSPAERVICLVLALRLKAAAQTPQ